MATQQKANGRWDSMMGRLSRWLSGEPQRINRTAPRPTSNAQQDLNDTTTRFRYLLAESRKAPSYDLSEMLKDWGATVTEGLAATQPVAKLVEPAPGIPEGQRPSMSKPVVQPFDPDRTLLPSARLPVSDKTKESGANRSPAECASQFRRLLSQHHLPRHKPWFQSPIGSLARPTPGVNIEALSSPASPQDVSERFRFLLSRTSSRDDGWYALRVKDLEQSLLP